MAYYYTNLVSPNRVDAAWLDSCQVAELIRRMTAATERAAAELGIVIIWRETGGSAYMTPDDNRKSELENAIAAATEQAIGGWYADGCPSADGCTVVGAAAALGISPNRVRRLPAELGVGFKRGYDWVFTSEDMARLRARRTTRGRPPKVSAG